MCNAVTKNGVPQGDSRSVRVGYLCRNNRNKGSEPFVRPLRPTAPGLADLRVRLALNLRLEGIVSQRRARLTRGANIGQPIRIDRA